jgi:hypothetical protein
MAVNWLVRSFLVYFLITLVPAVAWANSVTIGWNANSETDFAGYNVYGSTTSGSGYTRLNSSLIKTTSYQDFSVTTGMTVYYVVTAVNTSNQESRYSNEVVAVVGCGYTISPTSREHSSDAGSGSISVSTSSACSWTAKSSASWITITSGGSGGGSGTVYYSLTANTSSSTRMGSITIQDKSFTISQSGTSSSSDTGGCTTASVPSDSWRGEYFNNTGLSGTPAMVRDDGNAFLNFNWSSGSPSSACGIGADYFSARWTRTVSLAAGRWRFTVSADDGVRLYVNNQLVINQWRDQAETAYSVDLDLASGNHILRMEYYEKTGLAVAKLSWSQISSSSTASWRGEYFTNMTLSGTPALVRDDGTGFLNFNWGSGSPASGIPADYFSARWLRTVNLAAGRWRFTVSADDGVRLYVNNNLVINQWRDQAETTYTVDLDVAAGDHNLRMEYYEKTGLAAAKLSWSEISSSSTSSWRGEYFTNTTLSGTPALVRDDGTGFLNFNWGSGSPASNIPADYFSVRWTRTVYFNAGSYTFKVTSDDGARLYINGNLVISRWVIQPATTISATVSLPAGNHTIRLEYYENTGLAEARLSW